ncbi:MAG: copper chaperone PCu(A)C [Pseudomonadales bacterium]|nr:copper chaperone PCu(A)C [Pseudomonadales bacterium]
MLCLRLLVFYRPLTLCLTAILSGGLVACAEQDLQVRDAGVRTLVPGTDKTVGYMVLENRSQVPMILVGASGREFRAIEMHTTKRVEETGMMQMRRLKEVAIKPGETVRFETGGMHLMLFGVQELNEPVVIELQFQDGTHQYVNFDVLGLVH